MRQVHSIVKVQGKHLALDEHDRPMFSVAFLTPTWDKVKYERIWKGSNVASCVGLLDLVHVKKHVDANPGFTWYPHVLSIIDNYCWWTARKELHYYKGGEIATQYLLNETATECTLRYIRLKHLVPIGTPLDYLEGE